MTGVRGEEDFDLGRGGSPSCLGGTIGEGFEVSAEVIVTEMAESLGRLVMIVQLGPAVPVSHGKARGQRSWKYRSLVAQRVAKAYILCTAGHRYHSHSGPKGLVIAAPNPLQAAAQSHLSSLPMDKTTHGFEWSES